MKYKYVYSITANVYVDQIKKTNNFNKKNFKSILSDMNSDILNEFFYYAVQNSLEIHFTDNQTISTYDTDFLIYLKSNSYTINHKILSNHTSLDDILFDIYKNSFNINNIFELSGCDLDEMYEKLCINLLKINNIIINIELIEFTNSYDDDYDLLHLSLLDPKNFKIISNKQFLR